MAKEKEIKTNAMRILDRQKIKYEVLQYECDEFIDGFTQQRKPARRSSSRLKRLWHREKASRIMCWCFRSQRKWI